jgi:hypothetical protein
MTNRGFFSSEPERTPRHIGVKGGERSSLRLREFEDLSLEERFEAITVTAPEDITLSGRVAPALVVEWVGTPPGTTPDEAAEMVASLMRKRRQSLEAGEPQKPPSKVYSELHVDRMSVHKRIVETALERLGVNPPLPEN